MHSTVGHIVASSQAPSTRGIPCKLSAFRPSCFDLQAQQRPGPPGWRWQRSWPTKLVGQPQRRRQGGVARAIDPEVFTDPDVPLSKLKQLLDEAIDNEDYTTAAQLRDTLQKRRFDNRYAVEEANERFYKAFQSGSLKDMAAVWGTGEHVQCIHPLAGCIAGRQAVMDSWKAILGSGRLKISIEDVRTFATDSHAYVTCLEIMEASDSRGRILATNIFEKQAGQWKIVHHHGSPVRQLA